MELARPTALLGILSARPYFVLRRPHVVDSYISSLQTKVCGQIDHLEFGSYSLGATRSQGSNNEYLALPGSTTFTQSAIHLEQRNCKIKILPVIQDNLSQSLKSDWSFCRADQTVRLLDVLHWEEDGIVWTAPSLMQLRALASSALALPRCIPVPFCWITRPAGQQNDAKLL